MKAEDLKKSISILYEMETNNCIMDRTIQQLNAQIDQLGIPQKYRTPIHEHSKKESYLEGIAGFGYMGGVFGFVIGCALAFVRCNGSFSLGGFILDTIRWILTGAVIGAIGSVIYEICRRKKEQKILDEQYVKSNALYRSNVTKDEIRVEKERRIQQNLIKERTLLESKRRESKIKLQAFYSKLEIDNDFRNFICMGYMNYFLKMDFASELKGKNGLYFLVREELKDLRTQELLSEISNKLDIVAQQLSYISDQLYDIKKQCTYLTNSCLRIANEAAQSNKLQEKQLEISKAQLYVQERIEAEEGFNNWLTIWNMN